MPDINSLDEDIKEIKTYLGKSADRHVAVMSQLAVIADRQDGMFKYQKECDLDRAEHGKRITILENSSSNTWKTACGLATVAAFFITLVVEYFKK